MLHQPELNPGDLLSEFTHLPSWNDSLKDYVVRLQEYMFSSKIRPIIFNSSPNPDKIDLIRMLETKLEQILVRVTDLREKVKDYHKKIAGGSHSFANNKHFILSKKYAYNSTLVLWMIQRGIRKIQKKLQRLKSNPDFKEIQKIFHSIKDRFDLTIKLFHENSTLLKDAQARLQVEREVVAQFQNLENQLIDKSQLETGDLLFSFKPKSYKDIVSSAVATVINSQVTHILLCIKVSNSVKLIDVHAKYGGLNIKLFIMHPHEVYIAMRPNISNEQRYLILRKVIEYWQAKPKLSAAKILAGAPPEYFRKFVNLFIPGFMHVPNIMTNKRNLFCSEFIDLVFKEAGILLTPKSRYSHMVSAAEILVSPLMVYLGLIFSNTLSNRKRLMNDLTDVNV